MFSEFMINYAPELALFGAIIASIAPFLRKRSVNDKNMLLTFRDLKGLAKNIHEKEIDFNMAIKQVDDLAIKIQTDVFLSIREINNVISDFKDSELAKKMLLGLSQLDELNQLLQNKDKTIVSLQTTIKSINKKLGVMENERKL